MSFFGTKNWAHDSHLPGRICATELYPRAPWDLSSVLGKMCSRARESWRCPTTTPSTLGLGTLFSQVTINISKKAIEEPNAEHAALPQASGIKLLSGISNSENQSGPHSYRPATFMQNPTDGPSPSLYLSPGMGNTVSHKNSPISSRRGLIFNRAFFYLCHTSLGFRIDWLMVNKTYSHKTYPWEQQSW